MNANKKIAVISHNVDNDLCAGKPTNLSMSHWAVDKFCFDLPMQSGLQHTPSIKV